MWCDNCLLVLPLRAGAIAWAVFMALYSIAGGIFLLKYGQFLFFVYPEWYIYGGVAMGVGSLACVNAIALSNRSYIWTRVCKFLWPFIIIASGVRAILMIWELKRGESNIQWECQNGGQLWGSTPETVQTLGTGVAIPSSICAGYGGLLTAFIISLLIDLFCQMYMWFLNWRFTKRLEHYSSLKGPMMGGIYEA